MGLYEINTTTIEIDNEDDDDDYEEFWEADSLEDSAFAQNVKEKYPGWYFVKLINFTSRTFEEVRTWLKDGNVRCGQYKELGWSSNCSYSVGVVFESSKDAVMFKLRWV